MELRRAAGGRAGSAEQMTAPRVAVVCWSAHASVLMASAVARRPTKSAARKSRGEGRKRGGFSADIDTRARTQGTTVWPAGGRGGGSGVSGLGGDGRRIRSFPGGAPTRSEGAAGRGAGEVSWRGSEGEWHPSRGRTEGHRWEGLGRGVL